MEAFPRNGSLLCGRLYRHSSADNRFRYLFFKNKRPPLCKRIQFGKLPNGFRQACPRAHKHVQLFAYCHCDYDRFRPAHRVFVGAQKKRYKYRFGRFGYVSLCYSGRRFGYFSASFVQQKTAVFYRNVDHNGFSLCNPETAVYGTLVVGDFIPNRPVH